MILGSMLGQYAYPTGFTPPTGTVGQIVSLYPAQNQGIRAFEPGNNIPLACEITAQGLPADPLTLTLTIRDPSATLTRHVDLIRNGPGLYSFNLFPPTPGLWAAEWTAPDLEASTGPVEFYVLGDIA